MTNQRELALLIENGLKIENVFEVGNTFFEEIFGNFYVCALGAAVVGKFSSVQTAYEEVEAEREVCCELRGKDLALAPDYVDIAARLLGIDFPLARMIDKEHMLGIRAATIINKLKQGSFPY